MLAKGVRVHGQRHDQPARRITSTRANRAQSSGGWRTRLPSERTFPKRRRAIQSKPDPNSNKVEGSGMDVVTLKVPTGLPVARGSMLATLPETDEKVLIVSGVRLRGRHHVADGLCDVQCGIILGTAASMSPEQARGKPVDKPDRYLGPNGRSCSSAMCTRSTRWARASIPTAPGCLCAMRGRTTLRNLRGASSGDQGKA